MSKKILLTLGIVAGLGVAALPLTSYADDNEVTINVTVTTGIEQTVNSSADAGNVDLSMTSNDFKEGVANVVVSTNSLSGYTLSIKDKDTDTNLAHTDGNSAHVIPAASGTLTAGTAGWGVKGGLVTTYTAMPASTGTSLTIKNTSGAAANDATTVTFGVATAGDQYPTTSSERYTDTVIFTAVAN